MLGMKFNKRYVLVTLMSLGMVAAATAVPTVPDTGLAKLSGNMQGQILSFSNLIVTVGYIAGIGFTMASIFKFKQHKDNPTQTPIGAPFAMFAVGIILVFLPALIKPAGESIFGSNPGAGVSQLAPLIPADKKGATT